MRIKAALVVCLILIVSCKKINLLSSTYIPPPTEFPNETPEYPNPTPVPNPPQEPEEKPIEVKPEVVENGTVFGGYGRRFKFKNSWYVLATNEYQYDTNSKTLKPTGKGAVLKIEDDGKTITKIHSLKLSDNLEQTEYWKNLHSKKLVITDTEVNIPIKAESQAWPKRIPYTITDSDNNNTYTVSYSNLNTNLITVYTYTNISNVHAEKLILHYSNRNSSDLLNWNSTSLSNIFNFPEPNFDNPNFQGALRFVDRCIVVYFKGKIFLFYTFGGYYDFYHTFYRDPSEGDFILAKNEYYTIEWGKDMSDAKNWVTNYIKNLSICSFVTVHHDANRLYVTPMYYDKYTYSDKFKLWYRKETVHVNDFVYTTEDGINWKKESLDIIDQYNPIVADRTELPSFYYHPATNEMLGYEMPDGTPFEPSYTELNGKYYRTFNSTYPMPPIKEIMETVDRFETNFTVTEEHIKKSGYYQLQVSSVAPDKAQESDWVNIMPNNETTSSIGWESGGADLFTLDGKIVRLVDYDREFKLNNQYETALALAEKYYNLLLNSPMSEFKKYDYYFLYYKAMADMLKIIKDKGSDYFRPDEAVTHYTFEL
ncbi:hypothetical protein [Brachyspira pilosicoli]|uniref:hypothetical protein n=1 Tax=Brachyspira pilosicoli TaxID=52584 RepID=UPI003005C1A2